MSKIKIKKIPKVVQEHTERLEQNQCNLNEAVIQLRQRVYDLELRLPPETKLPTKDYLVCFTYQNGRSGICHGSSLCSLSKLSPNTLTALREGLVRQLADDVAEAGHPSTPEWTFVWTSITPLEND